MPATGTDAGGPPPNRVPPTRCVASLRMRVLALDYGRARCGCAISDPTGVLATPLAAIPAPDSRRGRARLRALVSELGVQRIGRRGLTRGRASARRLADARGIGGGPWLTDHGARHRSARRRAASATPL